MKRLTLLALLALISASALFATPITGSVVFWGETDSPNEHDWSNVSGFQCSTYNIWLTGDLASFTIWRPNTERFSLTSAGFSEGSGDYTASFVSISFSDSVRTVDSFEAHGEGIMSMSGFDATYGTWSVSVLGYYVPDHTYMNEGHSIVSFVASGNAVTPPR